MHKPLLSSPAGPFRLSGMRPYQRSIAWLLLLLTGSFAFGQNRRWLAVRADAVTQLVRQAVTPAAAAGDVYLSDLNWTSATIGFGSIQKDKSVDGNPVRLDGVTYAKGIGTHAVSTILYNLEGGYTHFSAKVGMNDEVDGAGCGSVAFEVYLDGSDAPAFSSGRMTAVSATQLADLDVTGVNELKLVVTDGGDGNCGDHADWADARLTPVPPVPDDEAPTTPGTLTATETTPYAVTLHWAAATDNVGVTGYQVLVNGAPRATVSRTVTTYKVTSLTPATAYTLSVKARDAAGNFSAAAEVSVTTPDGPPVCEGTGAIDWEVFATNGNTATFDWTQAPVQTGSRTQLDIPQSSPGKDYFNQRLRGYLQVPQAGEYTFWVAGDDGSEILLSPDDQPENAVRIAYNNGYTPDYPNAAPGKSAPIALLPCVRYYIEVRNEELSGGDFVKVQWQLPDGTRQDPIPGRWLSAPDKTYPSGLTATPTAGEVTLNWTAPNLGADSYKVYDATSGTDVLLAENITATTYTATGFTPGAPAAFKVSAVKNGAESAKVSVSTTLLCENIAGFVRADRWNNYTGTVTDIGNIGAAPDATRQLNTLSAPSTSPDVNNYAQRVKGLIVPQVSGAYRFWVQADDVIELYLSTDENPAHKRKIAFTTSYTPNYDSQPTQQSAVINLEKCRSYYFEVYHLEYGGSDAFKVRWQLPKADGTAGGAFQDPIPGSVLQPEYINFAPTVTADFTAPYIYNNADQQTVNLTGIGDANEDRAQTLTFTAVSSDESVVPDPVVAVNGSTGTLKFTPTGKVGTTEITLTVRDDGGTEKGGADTKTVKFTVNVIDPLVNVAPTLNPVADLAVPKTPVQRTVNLAGISDGDDNKNQVLTFSATSSNPAIIPDPAVEYTPGQATAALKFTPTSAIGESTITVTVQDDAAGSQGGQDTRTVSFKVQVKGTGLVEDLDDGNLAGWGFGPPVHTVTNENGVLKVAAIKGTFDGFNFDFAPLDLSAHPYLSMKIKTAVDFKFRLFLWDVKNSYNSGSGFDFGTKVIKASEDFVEYTFYFKDLPDAGVDLTNIKRLLLNINPQYNFNGSFFIEDLRIGDQARLMPSLSLIPDQQVYRNAGPQTVQLTGIDDGTTGTNPVGFAATSSDPGLIANPTVAYTAGERTARLTYAPVANQTGEAVITVKAAAAGTNADNVKTFKVSVGGNQAPEIAAVAGQKAAVGVAKVVPLKGINDGNPETIQGLAVMATSSNPSVVPNPEVDYVSGDLTGSLTLTPAAPGTATITIAVKDDAGGPDTRTVSFPVQVFGSLNNAPTLAAAGAQSFLINAGEQTLSLGGIGDGDPGVQQPLVLTATTANAGVITAPRVVYTQGSPTAQLKYTPVKVGAETITVTLTDGGGAAGNDGNQSVTLRVPVNVRPVPITGFVENFLASDAINWAAGPGNYSFEVVQTPNADIRIVHNKPNLFPEWWAAVPLTFPEADLSGNPYLSFGIKVSNPMKIWVFTGDAGGVNGTNVGAWIDVPADGNFKNIFYDFTGANGNLTRIDKLYWNFNPGAGYQGTVTIRNVRVGDQADNQPNFTPQVTIGGIGSRTVFKSAGATHLALGGISDGFKPNTGGDNTTVVLSATSSNPGLVPDPAVSPVSADGKATLTFTPVAGQTGSATLTVTGTKTGSIPGSRTFTVEVVEPGAGGAVGVAVNLADQRQTIQGFGVYGGDLSQVSRLTKDLGISVHRHEISAEFEPVNDNSDPGTINLAGYDLGEVASDQANGPGVAVIKALKASGVKRFIATVWSPPAWMKRNLSAPGSVAPGGDFINNRLNFDYAEEFAEYLAAYTLAFKQETGADLYAISIQNELEFNQFFYSAIYSVEEYVRIVKVVGRRFEKEGIATRLFGPENLPQQNNVLNYFNAILNDPEAIKYFDIFAIHNYDADAITGGNTGAQDWQSFYNAVNNYNLANGTRKELWMTETSGFPESWTKAPNEAAAGPVQLAQNLYNALGFGRINAWVWWTPDQLLENNRADAPTNLFRISQHYYKYVRPGAVAVGNTVTGSPDVLVNSFRNPDGSVVVILINKLATPTRVTLSGAGLPDAFQRFVTAENVNFAQLPDATGGTVTLPATSVTTLYNDVIAPTAPLAPDGSAAAFEAYLHWQPADDVGGITGYQITIAGKPEYAQTVTGTSATVAGLSDVTTYTFSVRAVDVAGNRSEPASLTLKTLDGTAPTAPVLSYGYILPEKGTLTWTAATDNVGVTGYDIYNGSVKMLGVGGNVTSYPFENLREGTVYNFSVRAKDAAGFETASNVVQNAIPEAGLTLAAACSPNPAATRRWEVVSTFSKATSFSWVVVGTGQRGTGSLPAGGTATFSTQTVKNNANSVTITWGSNKTATATGTAQACSDPAARAAAAGAESTALPLEVFPNPATGQFTLRYAAEAAGKVQVLITDVLSRPALRRDWAVQPGVNELPLTTQGLKTGQYVITVTEGGKRVFKRFGVQ